MEVGDKIANYEIVAQLGRGGFGYVWKGRDLTVRGRIVAIKELIESTPEGLADFLREMEILSSLRHPGILTFHHALEEGRYLVMEYVPEGSLRSGLGNGERMSAVKAVAIIASLCRVLAAVHALKIVHRDLKPDNIYVQGDGTVRVGDFGIAGVIKGDGILGRAGTLAYMAPEMFRRELGRRDHRVDLYSAGVVLMELLTGRVPFEASDQGQLIYNVVFEEPAIPRIVPHWLQTVLRKALAKSPDLRFQSAEEFEQALTTGKVPHVMPKALIQAGRANATAERLIGRGKIQSAMTEVERGLLCLQDYPRLLLTKAKCLLVLRKADEATALLLRARKLDPGIQCEKELGYALICKGEAGKAVSCLTEFALRHPDDLGAFSLLCEALHISRLHEQVAEIASTLCDEDDSFMNNLLVALAILKGPDEALAMMSDRINRMENIPGFIAYNRSVLWDGKQFQNARLASLLFFAPRGSLTGMVGKRRGRMTARIEVESTGTTKQRVVHVNNGFLSIGRAERTDIVISEPRRVSRYHGLVYLRDMLFYYRDLCSTTGSIVDGVAVGKDDVPLVGMNVIEIGSAKLKITY